MSGWPRRVAWHEDERPTTAELADRSCRAGYRKRATSDANDRSDHGGRPRYTRRVSVVRGKQRSSERHELPRLEAFDGPAALDREGDVDLGAMEAEQQVERKRRIEPGPQLVASREHLVHDPTHAMAPPVDEALPGEGHVRIDARCGMDGGQQWADASIDLVAVLDDQCEPTRPIRRIDDIRHPVSSEDLFGCTRATARDLERRDQQLGLGVEGEVDRLHRDAGVSCDRVHRRRRVALPGEAGQGSFRDPPPRRLGAFAPT